MKLRHGIHLITLALFLSLTTGCRWFNGANHGGQGEASGQNEMNGGRGENGASTVEENNNEAANDEKNADPVDPTVPLTPPPPANPPTIIPFGLPYNTVTFSAYNVNLEDYRKKYTALTEAQAQQFWKDCGTHFVTDQNGHSSVAFDAGFVCLVLETYPGMKARFLQLGQSNLEAHQAVDNNKVDLVTAKAWNMKSQIDSIQADFKDIQQTMKMPLMMVALNSNDPRPTAFAKDALDALKTKNPQWNSNPSLVQQLDDAGIALETLFRDSLLVANQGDANLIVSLFQYAEGMNPEVLLDLDAGSAGLIPLADLKFL